MIDAACCMPQAAPPPPHTHTQRGAASHLDFLLQDIAELLVTDWWLLRQAAFDIEPVAGSSHDVTLQPHTDLKACRACMMNR